MTAEELIRIIGRGENVKVEFKECSNSISSTFYETVVSFSNTDGGTIFLGVNDDGNLIGINHTAEAKLQKDIISALNSKDCVTPPIYVQPFIVEVSGKMVMVVQIQASSQIHKYAGRIYSREFESDLDITDDQQKVSDLYFRKRNFFTEGKIYEHLSFADLDKTLFDKARRLIRTYRSDHPWLSVSDQQMLKDSVLWRKDFTTGQEGLTLSAALVFGKEAVIQSLLPAYKVEAMVRIHNKDRWDDRLTLRKNLIDSYTELRQFINKHLPEKFYLENGQRTDLRDLIFREVIGNVIVHREYTSALSTEVIISETEVTITNPNKPLFFGPIDPKGFNPFPKNPNIRKFFTAFGWTDEIGSGVRNTNKYLPLYVANAKPLFLEDSTFKTYIPLEWRTLADFAEQIQQWLEIPETALPHLQKGLITVTVSSLLPKNNWEELVLHLVSSWHHKGIQLGILNWDLNQVFTKDDIEQVSSWSKKGIQLLRKKNWYLISILALTTEPTKLSELMSWLNYKNKKTFRDNYINPLRQTGLISFTNPDKPTSPDNKYVITEAGKMFLSSI